MLTSFIIERNEVIDTELVVGQTFHFVCPQITVHVLKQFLDKIPILFTVCSILNFVCPQITVHVLKQFLDKKPILFTVCILKRYCVGFNICSLEYIFKYYFFF